MTSALEQYDRHYLRGKWIEVKSASPPHKLAKDDATTPALGSSDGDGDSASAEAEEESPAPVLHPGGRPLASPNRRRGEGSRSGRIATTISIADAAGAKQLGEPRKVALPSASPPQPDVLLQNALLGGLPNPAPPGLQQQEQQLAWLTALGSAAVALGVAPGAPPAWPPPAVLSGLVPPQLVQQPSIVNAAAAALGGADVVPSEGGLASTFATPEFRQNLEQLLRQFSTSGTQVEAI